MRNTLKILVLIVCVFVACTPDPPTGMGEEYTLTTGSGIGIISLGDQAQSVIDNLGEPMMRVSTDDNINYTHILEYFNIGLKFYIESMSSQLDMTKPIVIISGYGPFLGKTDKGIKLGANATEVHVAHGDPLILELNHDIYDGIEFFYIDEILQEIHIK